jgi:hypothetical protein
LLRYPEFTKQKGSWIVLAISCSASPDGNTETTKHQRAQWLSDPELAADLVHRGPVLNMPQGEGDLFVRSMAPSNMVQCAQNFLMQIDQV